MSKKRSGFKMWLRENHQPDERDVLELRGSSRDSTEGSVA
jgi:hypothetical protein